MLGVLSRRWRPVALGFLVLLSVASVPAVGEEPQITDPEQDAYPYPGPLNSYLPKPPNPLLSNDTADILAVTFATATAPQPSHDRAYTVSVRTRREPHGAYAYLVGGSFGQDCFLIHDLHPGTARDALVVCRAGETYRLAGSVTGSVASVNRDTVSATFSFRAFTMPAQLKKDPELRQLYALTCPADGCSSDGVIDDAFADKTFKV